MSLHLHRVSICPIPHAAYNRHPKITHFPLSACASFEFPHWTCCAQHTWTRWAFAESQLCWEEDWGTSPFPPMRALLSLTPEGLIIYKQKGDSQHCLLFFFERRKNFWVKVRAEGSRVQNRHSPCTLRKAFKQVWLHAHVEDLALTTVQYINDLNGSRKKTKTISQHQSIQQL